MLPLASNDDSSVQGALASLEAIMRLQHQPSPAFWASMCSVCTAHADQLLLEALLGRLQEGMQLHRQVPDPSFVQTMEAQVLLLVYECAPAKLHTSLCSYVYKHMHESQHVGPGCCLVLFDMYMA